MKVAIKRMDEENFSAFANLIQEFADFEKLTPPNKNALERLKSDSFSKKPKIEIFLAHHQGKVVGYMMVFMTYSSFLALPTLYIEDIYVAEKHRQDGIGQALFGYAKNMAKERGCGRLELSVLTWNTPAINFYKKNQMEPQSDQMLYRLKMI